MAWLHLVFVRAAVGLAVDVLAIWAAGSDWPGYATALGVVSGSVGFWYARRIEQGGIAPTWTQALLVLAGTAPEALVVIPSVALAFLALPFESNWNIGEGALFILAWFAVLSPTIVVQAVATWTWRARLHRRGDDRAESTVVA